MRAAQWLFCRDDGSRLLYLKGAVRTETSEHQNIAEIDDLFCDFVTNFHKLTVRDLNQSDPLVCTVFIRHLSITLTMLVLQVYACMRLFVY